MRDLWTVASFTIKEMLKRKSFLISNFIILVLIVIGFNVPNLLGIFQNNQTQTSGNDTIIIIDEKKLFEGNVEELNQMNLGKRFAWQTETMTKEQIKEKIDSKEIYAAIVLKKQGNEIGMQWYVDSININSSGPQEVVEAMKQIYTNHQIQNLELSQEQLQALYPKFEMQLVQTNENPASGNVFAIMLLSLILFYAIYFCAYQVSSSITTEKTSKIMETLVTSTTPRTIVLGKTIGIGIIGLVQVASIIIVSIICSRVFLEPEMIEGIIDLSKITPTLGILTLIYFVLGYALYSLLYALTGSTVSKPEDINSANGPVAILAVIGFYLAYFSMMNPTSQINVFASIFPFSAPFSMPFRVMMGTATTTQIVLSIGVLLVSIIVVAKVSVKIYSSAILNYGTKLNLKHILKLYKEK